MWYYSHSVLGLCSIPSFWHNFAVLSATSACEKLSFASWYCTSELCTKLEFVQSLRIVLTFEMVSKLIDAVQKTTTISGLKLLLQELFWTLLWRAVSPHFTVCTVPLCYNKYITSQPHVASSVERIASTTHSSPRHQNFNMPNQEFPEEFHITEISWSLH